jgi:hypothetical protein
VTKSTGFNPLNQAARARISRCHFFFSLPVGTLCTSEQHEHVISAVVAAQRVLCFFQSAR